MTANSKKAVHFTEDGSIPEEWADIIDSEGSKYLRESIDEIILQELRDKAKNLKKEK